LKTDLFDRKTWQILGLSRTQMALAGAGLGAGIGVQVDLALGGLTFGVFTAMGSTSWCGVCRGRDEKDGGRQDKGAAVGRRENRGGPVENDQLLYVLADRCLIYFSHVINWTHSRRDTPESGALCGA
jgi:hypothetical protein